MVRDFALIFPQAEAQGWMGHLGLPLGGEFSSVTWRSGCRGVNGPEPSATLDKSGGTFRHLPHTRQRISFP